MKIKIPPIPYTDDLDDLKSWLSVNILGNLSKLSLGFNWNSIDKTNSNLLDILTRNHNDLQNIQGGSTNERYHVSSAINTSLNNGLSVTVTLAKITALGTNGSLTFTNGILTSKVDPT